jgi:hypothetical protein
MMELAVTSADEAVISFLYPIIARRRRVRFCEEPHPRCGLKAPVNHFETIVTMLSIYLINLIEGG